MSQEHDAIVVGAGAGGLTVAIGLADMGRRVALVESGRIGGECTNVGCIPSKRLIHLSREPALRANAAAALADVRATRDALAQREAREIAEHPRIESVAGRGVLRSGPAVAVTSPDGAVRTLAAPNVILATGSRPRTVAIPGLPPERVLTNESLFELAEPPGHLAIVGAGPVGLEMACALTRLGSRVSLIDMADRVLPQADPAASATLLESLAEQGIAVHLGARAARFDEGAGRILTLGAPAGEVPLEGVDAVLMALGRTPNADAAGGLLAGGPTGITVDQWGRTSMQGVFAVGDVTPLAHQTHAANAFGRRIVQRIALTGTTALNRRVPAMPSAVYADPEVAWVGPVASERARRCPDGALLDITVRMADTDRGLTDGVRHGFVQISAVRLTGRVVAATVVGPRAAELLPLLTYAVDHGVSLLRIQRMVHAYPTLAGAIGRAADEFARRTLPNLPTEALAYGRHRVLGGLRRRLGG
ncbi:MAG: NAD(P)/FAD-dependent oxidoreductase [Miltoncostaeaceae bacterium]